MKVSQFVDPACAAQEHIETKILNFHLLSVFPGKLRQGVSRQLQLVEELEKSLFLFGNSLDEEKDQSTQISLRPQA